MGSKLKSWYHLPYFNTEWLFKQPTNNTGEHWAEKVAAEVARLLGVAHAKVELAAVKSEKGSMTESFLHDMDLIHGNEILAGVVLGYDKTKVRRQSQHTLANIWFSLEKTFQTQHGAGETAKRRFAEYVILDALIGNVDRHHENWGLQKRRVGNTSPSFMAPSFDHASSLGRELEDEGGHKSRNNRLAENRVGEYAENGRGGIYWKENDRRGPCPLELIRCAVQEYPETFQTAMRRLDRVDKSSLSEIVERIPEGWMSPLERQFAIALMRYNLDELRRVF